MAKRFTDSELWNRDWFLSLEGKFQLFCIYLRDNCDCAGVWNPAFKRFEQSTGFRIDQKEYVNACNKDGSKRIIVLENGKWWITGFIEDQYKTKKINENNSALKGVLNSLRFNNVPYNSIGYEVGALSPLQGAKDKDKDKDKSINLDKGESEGEILGVAEVVETPHKKLFSEFMKNGPVEWEAYRALAWKQWMQTFSSYPQHECRAVEQAKFYKLKCGAFVISADKWIREEKFLVDWENVKKNGEINGKAAGTNQKHSTYRDDGTRPGEFAEPTMRVKHIELAPKKALEPCGNTG